MKIKLEDLMKIIASNDMRFHIYNSKVVFHNYDLDYKELLHDYGALNVIELDINPTLLIIKLEDNTDGIGD